MNDTATVAAQQREYWNGEATRRWVTEQTRIDRLMAAVTEAALAAAAPKAGERVLDIGCGSGTTLLRLAAAVGPAGQALGVDISEQQLVLARQRIEAAGARNARVAHDDAASHAFQPATFDLAFSRFGVMFFADPIVAFRNIRGAMKGGGRLALAVFRPAADNPWANSSVAAIRHLIELPPPPGPEEPGQFAWGDPARVHQILGGAGFRDLALKPVDVRFHLGANASEAAAFAMYIGQGARLLHGQPETTREAARAAFETFFKEHETADGVALPGSIWLISALN
jgi:SAM-dependent methyltransferase